MKKMSLRSVFVFFLLIFVFAGSLHAAPAPDLDDQTRAIATELRCVVCQNLSVADSPSEMAHQMRMIVRERLRAGDSPEQVIQYFVDKYGEWILLKPRRLGFNWPVLLAPAAPVAFGLVVFVILVL